MKRTILSTALTLSLVLSGGLALGQQTEQPQQQQTAPDAQQPYHRHFHHPNPERETARLTQQLNLSPEQSTKLQPILADRDQRMAALWSNQALAPQDKHQQMRAIQESTRQQLEAVLTPGQLQQMRSMHHGHHRGPNGYSGQPQPPNPPSHGV
jgi:hypothetical protein